MMNEENDRLSELKERTKRCCCRYCGGALEIRRIIFSDYEAAKIEIFCSQCDRIECGVEPEIYRCAQYFVDELDFDHYKGLDRNEKTRKMNIAKVSDIMTWCVKNLGLLDSGGFTVPLQMAENLLGQALLLGDDDLDQY